MNLFKKTRVFSWNSGRHKSKGFSLVELLVGMALFLIISVGIYNAFMAVLDVISLSRSKIIAMDLANERFELIRNLPYDDVGIVGGLPSGVIEHAETFVRSGYTFSATTTIRNIDDPFDGKIGGSPNDTSPADYRLVEIEIGCSACKNFPPVFVSTHVAPKNLETQSTNGALFISVFDANGQPVPDAQVSIENNQGAFDVINDETNANGMLQIVDAPPGVNAYEITVTKSGYTTDRTLTPGAVGNPNPSRPHATVVIQQVTQVSFVIDKVSTIHFSSMDENCAAVPSVNFSMSGTKLIGTNPDVLKYDEPALVTSGSGTLTVSGLEWDTYPITLTDGSYDLLGTNPLFPVSLAQDSDQDIDFIVASKSPRTLLVIVKDAATGLPLENSTVEIDGSTDETLVTERGFINQTDWSHGGGQATSTDPLAYFESDDVIVDDPDGEVKLDGSFGTYYESGTLTSSSFDTGSPSNFHQIFWLPSDQPVETGADSVRMQIATNNDEMTWVYRGSDGAEGTYYTSSDPNIHSVHNGDRFLRYKLFLGTASTTYTPNVSDVSMTFSSLCTPPGQVAFTGLASGQYTLTVSHDGYQTYEIDIDIDESWQQEEVLLLSE